MLISDLYKMNKISYQIPEWEKWIAKAALTYRLHISAVHKPHEEIFKYNKHSSFKRKHLNRIFLNTTVNKIFYQQRIRKNYAKRKYAASY